jgi:hypothetical protein
MFHNLALAEQGWGNNGTDRDEFSDSPPCFGDIDGDGAPKIILYSDHEKAGEYVNRGNCLWVLNPDMTRVKGFETQVCSGMPLYTGSQDNIVQVAEAQLFYYQEMDSEPQPAMILLLQNLSTTMEFLYHHCSILFQSK